MRSVFESRYELEQGHASGFVDQNAAAPAAAGIEKRRSAVPEGQGNMQPGGEPLWNEPKDLVIFYPLRGTPNRVLNRRLPGITARNVLSIVRSEIVHPGVVPTNLTRVETFPGAACLGRFPVMHASRQISRGLLLPAKAAPLQGL